VQIIPIAISDIAAFRIVGLGTPSTIVAYNRENP
jgi:hypothetical protein